MQRRIYGETVGWRSARFDANAPQPGPEYERCILDGTWCRNWVEHAGRRFRVCHECHRGFGSALGAILDGFMERLAEGVKQALLEEARP